MREYIRVPRYKMSSPALIVGGCKACSHGARQGCRIYGSLTGSLFVLLTTNAGNMSSVNCDTNHSSTPDLNRAMELVNRIQLMGLHVHPRQIEEDAGTGSDEGHRTRHLFHRLLTTLAPSVPPEPQNYSARLLLSSKTRNGPLVVDLDIYR